MSINPAKAILIIRTSAIGDVVMSSHLPDGLRCMYPEARIFWLAEPQVKPLLEHHPAINGVITFPKSRWKDLFRRRKYLALLGELRSFVTVLRHEQFDLVLDVTNPARHGQTLTDGRASVVLAGRGL